MDKLAKNFYTTYQFNNTIENKQECLTILAKIWKPRKSRRSSLRHCPKIAIHFPISMNTWHQCCRFHGLEC